MQLPLGELAKRGHQATWTREIRTNSVTGEPLVMADTVVAQRFGETAVLNGIWEKLAARPNRPRMVYELDDDLLNIDFEANPIGHRAYSTAVAKDGLRRCAELADVCTVSTEPLAEVLRQFNPNVVVIPNAIPATMLDLPDTRRTDGTVTVGWAGSDTHGRDFDEIASELVRFVNRSRNVEFHAIGALFPSLTKIQPGRLRHTRWFKDVPEYHASLDFHVGVIPLRPSIFNNSKSAVKALEFAARGIPVVASDVGPYSDFVRHGETGFLTSRPHEFARYLRDLVNDQEMREAMGKKARELAAEHTIDKRADEWEQVLA